MSTTINVKLASLKPVLLCAESRERHTTMSHIKAAEALGLKCEGETAALKRIRDIWSAAQLTNADSLQLSIEDILLIYGRK